MKILSSALFVVSAIKRSEYSWNTEVPYTIYTTEREARKEADRLNDAYSRRGYSALQYEVLPLNTRIEEIISNATDAAQYSDGE